ncbi:MULTISPECIES: hypothetical protein [Moorena]|uniref:hypothetical protein n=1 Tax=Moorena TaxID=1155738 RepID=UPI0012B51AB1|nr:MULTISPECIES: hypothetical protein [Moorena]NEP30600.1 hypothetical protein [Moorena sp. SIO3B2]NEQ06354.1 hypothetical protein [Moorena sp. SIO4E2]NEQ16610.1 hypothetical protein [Moorena sp. SIO3E2]NES41286.1 hypothetical protein [Moorena sp. SIO2C4]
MKVIRPRDSGKQVDTVVRYGQQPNPGYRENEGSPFPNAPYVTVGVYTSIT